MFLYVILAVFVVSPALPAIVTENSHYCSNREFGCGDGACISLDRLCDGQFDCADGADEAFCFSNLNNDLIEQPIITRSKRQSNCRRYEFKCRDGTCISFDGKCDGMVDCPDGSDESYPLCRNEKCQSNWFKCTYGACVDGSAPCNGRRDCADNSDELQPRCLNTTQMERGQFICRNGERITVVNQCDGNPDCQDGSDETVWACAFNKCSAHLFKCAYGACVDRGADCNNIKECADGSDESDELCNRSGNGVVTPTRPTIITPTPVPPTKKPTATGPCVLPPFPDHGRYTVSGLDNPTPGNGYDAINVKFSCNSGYGIQGNPDRFCIGGDWYEDFPKCIPFCKLPKSPSIEYRCLNTGNSDGTRECQEQEPSGTRVVPKCKPLYRAPNNLNVMTCIDGSWDFNPYCVSDCGTVTPVGENLVIGGRSAKKGELPWHAGIYTKTTSPYKQICGGSLVSANAVISAAHCFWSDTEELQPATRFAVALGKLYRPWNDPNDDGAQKSEITSIKIPNSFQGVSTHFQSDIAIVLLTTPVVYKTFIRPVCVDFDLNFNKNQLKEGNLGKVAGWGLTAENGNASQVLKVVELPVVGYSDCYASAPLGFRAYITSDKICAGFQSGTALCHGDSGGGLTFPQIDKTEQRYYLRGIVSTAPNNNNLCNAAALTTFTEIVKLSDFISLYVSF